MFLDSLNPHFLHIGLFVIVDVFNRQKDLPIQIKHVRALAKEVIALEKESYDEVAIYLVTEKRICELHEQYFNDPSPTDCISFPLDKEKEAGYCVLGSVFVCPKIAIEYALNHHADPYEETALYIVHGLLHLLGYDDLNPKERIKMRRAEKKHLLHIKNKGIILKK